MNPARTFQLKATHLASVGLLCSAIAVALPLSVYAKDGDEGKPSPVATAI